MMGMYIQIVPQRDGEENVRVVESHDSLCLLGSLSELLHVCEVGHGCSVRCFRGDIPYQDGDSIPRWEEKDGWQASSFRKRP